MPKQVIVLIVLAVLGAISVVYGAETGSDSFLASGLAVGFLSLVCIPVLYQRVNKRRRLFSRKDVLLVWEYAPYETERIAAREAKRTRKTSTKLSILVAVCMAIVFAPFVFIVDIPQSTRSLLKVVGIIAVLLPFTSLYFAPAYTASMIKKTPSTTIIGRDYILLNNRYIGINDRAGLELVGADLRTGDDGEVYTILMYRFRMRYGNPITFPVDVPIPGGRTDEAIQFVESLKSNPN